MTTHDTIEKDLERLSETVSLRADEKHAHRENLLAFMEKNPKRTQPSFAWLHMTRMRSVSAFALILIVSGAGAVSAAEGAMPGDTLYPVKLKVTEPARSAFILDDKEKVAYEVERADRRLKELALLSASESPDAAITELIADSLSDSIAAINEEVTALTATGEADEALETNADLQSMLAAHQQILAHVEERNPELSASFDTVSASVDTAIANSENAEASIEDALEVQPADAVGVDAHAGETKALRTQIAEGIAALDIPDQETVAAVLSEVDTIMEEAEDAKAAGDTAEAYLLFTEADQRLNELQTFIEADRDLGIGVLK